MALNRPRVDVSAVAGTSVVLGNDRGANTTSYYEYFGGSCNRLIGAKTKLELTPPSEIFHRTETKFPKSIAQASFGKKSSKQTLAVYQGRIRDLKKNMDVHLVNAVPLGPRQSDIRERPTETSQMKTDYVDRNHLLRKWVDIQTSNMPKLPTINHQCNIRRQTEAGQQYQWPKRDSNLIYQKLRK